MTLLTFRPSTGSDWNLEALERTAGSDRVTCKVRKHKSAGMCTGQINFCVYGLHKVKLSGKKKRKKKSKNVGEDKRGKKRERKKKREKEEKREKIRKEKEEK